ncbi:DgyrCDS12797 [Dimorphilus gyrociliatus]|uniref:DgyrCDS12797 n=1 Tax=Dimorphilus gyrociliatus TaxID=2664684 RepID=A0A7I8W8S7_9ANNE|nr:DgyrCDS12797 [Dimorphilus gyrociliatus]
MSKGNNDDRAERDGCAHYERKCALISPCCKKPYVCRLCHDENENHELNRKEVVTIKCLKCSVYQEVQSSCEDCGTDFATYFCKICRMFDSKDDGKFHCIGCGICRKGGKENYTHCDNCGYCLSNKSFKEHKCISNVSLDNCTVCLESLHNSIKPFITLRCSHLIHEHCERQMAEKGLFRCPLCNESMADMTSFWKQLDNEIEQTEMPEEYVNLEVWINCGDCHKKSKTKFHIVGLKCAECGSYNTVETSGRETRENNENLEETEATDD